MNTNIKKIGIAGIGGIGGFVGAPLAKYYQDNKDVEIIFICRGQTKEVIAQKGLIIESKAGTETVHPDLVSNKPDEIGTLDVLILTCKTYSLENMIQNYQRCIGNQTAIITLQNVVNGKEIIQSKLDRGRIIEGCIYVASNVKSPGHVQHVGGPGKIFIGGEKESEYHWLTDLLTRGGLDVTFKESIKEILWKKYLFVAPVAAITTAYNVTFGQLLEDKDLIKTLENMMVEIQSLARNDGVYLSAEDITTSKDMLSKFPYQAKSSLQLDFENSKQNEKLFLVDYVIDSSKRNGLEVSAYNQITEMIVNR